MGGLFRFFVGVTSLRHVSVGSCRAVRKPTDIVLGLLILVALLVCLCLCFIGLTLLLAQCLPSISKDLADLA
jgi:hypothetical protein